MFVVNELTIVLEVTFPGMPFIRPHGQFLRFVKGLLIPSFQSRAGKQILLSLKCQWITKPVRDECEISIDNLPGLGQIAATGGPALPNI
jgi:hypothetical protein